VNIISTIFFDLSLLNSIECVDKQTCDDIKIYDKFKYSIVNELDVSFKNPPDVREVSSNLGFVFLELNDIDKLSSC
jgi:hypothetical protein